MKIIDILQTKFNNEFLQKDIISLNEEWSLYSVIKINASIFLGWLENDDLLIVNVDGVFLYDIRNKDFIMEDYESDFKKNLSTNNLHYSLKDRNEIIDVFGLRGGGGNLLTVDNKWNLEIVNIYNGYRIPKLTNYRTRQSWFFKLQDISYEGYLYCGFSKTQNYFVLFGDQGVNIFKKTNIE
ncbi:hypothetical protein [Chryseobacterium luquanense]|uniref:Uncharacterized protein n=1 Tax=Chryseobacterium luquanense TaxID=2983766 RepID=A0ABT3Y907_9FLAO|nr:hypothetical protein [Chryseobacterium luquanense]MCX8534659.1 hypothetical protein [Chryseobacterium luquanense]